MDVSQGRVDPGLRPSPSNISFRELMLSRVKLVGNIQRGVGNGTPVHQQWNLLQLRASVWVRTVETR